MGWGVVFDLALFSFFKKRLGWVGFFLGLGFFLFIIWAGVFGFLYNMSLSRLIMGDG